MRTVLRGRLADSHRPAIFQGEARAWVGSERSGACCVIQAEPIECGDGEEGTEVRPPAPQPFSPDRTPESVLINGHQWKGVQGKRMVIAGNQAKRSQIQERT